MTAALLDTHVLVWALFDDPRLGAVARRLIDGVDDVFVSVASIYEIDFKRRDTRRLRAQDSLLARMPRNMPAFLPSIGFNLLAIDAEVAWRAARLPIDHGDPWDRILLAQAIVLDVPLLSADETLRRVAQDHPETMGVVAF